MLPIAQAAASAAPLPVAEFLSQLGRCHAALDAAPVARDLFSKRCSCAARSTPMPARWSPKARPTWRGCSRPTSA